jgi:folate-binding protein YgfZ
MHNSTTSVTNLTNYGILAVSGAKASELLQGQLSCDMSQINPEQARDGALCNLKGRVVALMTVIQIDSDLPTYYLVIPTDLILEVTTHLRKIAPLFRVNIEDISQHYQALALMGADSHELVQQLHSVTLKTTHYASAQTPGKVFINLVAPEQQVILAILDNASIAPLTAQVAAGDNQQWNLALIKSGIAVITSQTTDIFLPQLLNLQHIGGLSFTKGCYLGQEVIARTYYRGKLKKTLCLISLTTREQLYPATKLLSVDKQPLGQLVNLAPCANNTYLALALINNDYATADNVAKKLESMLATNIALECVLEKILDEQFYNKYGN